MTVIAAKIIKDNILGDSIEMACDEQVTSGHGLKYTSKDSGNYDAYAKVLKMNGMLFGSAGKVSEMKLFSNFARNHKPVKASEYDVLDMMLEFYDRAKKKKSDFVAYNLYMLGFDGKLFYISAYNVNEVKSFGAVGSGMDFAIAAMHLGNGVKKAVEVSIKFDLYCGGNVKFYSLKKKK